MYIFDTSRELHHLIGYDLKLKSSPINLLSSMEVPVFKTKADAFSFSNGKRVKGRSLYLPFVHSSGDNDSFLIDTHLFEFDKNSSLFTLPPGVIVKPYGLVTEYSARDTGIFLKRASEIGLKYFTTYARDLKQAEDSPGAFKSCIMVYCEDFEKFISCSPSWTPGGLKEIRTGVDKWNESLEKERYFIFDQRELEVDNKRIETLSFDLKGEQL